MNEKPKFESATSEIRLDQLDNQILRDHIESSRAVYEAHGITLEDAIWKKEGEFGVLTLMMQTNTEDQGYDGVLHGGITAFAVDAAGVAGLIVASGEGKIAMTQEIRSIKFLKPFPAGELMKIVGKVLSRDEKKLSCAATISRVSKNGMETITATAETDMRIMEQKT